MRWTEAYSGSLSSLTTDIDIEFPVQLVPPLSRTETGLQPPSITPSMHSFDSQLQQSSASCVVQSPSIDGLSTPKEPGAQHSSGRHTAGRNKYMALLLSPQAVVKPHQWTSVVSVSLWSSGHKKVS